MARTEEELNKQLATIPNQELHEQCRDLLSNICMEGMKAFTMSIPPMVDDSDMLLGELINRFEAQITRLEEMRSQLSSVRLMLMAHPEYRTNIEFEDQLSMIDSILESVKH